MDVYASIWVYEDVNGCICMYMDVYRCIRMFPGVHGHMWMYIDVYGCMWGCPIAYRDAYGCLHARPTDYRDPRVPMKMRIGMATEIPYCLQGCLWRCS